MTLTSFGTLALAVAAFLAAAVAARLLKGAVARLESRLETVTEEDRAAVRARVAALGRALTLLAYLVAALAAVSLGLDRLGISEPQWHPRQVVHWLLTHGVNLVIVVIGAIVVVRAANLAIEHLRRKLGKRKGAGDLEWQRRAATLGGILTRSVTAAVGFVSGLMILRELSIDVLPILTGAGIVGLAIGFGAQNFVRDVISGFFLILEDQVRVGDQARVNGVAGVVEEINLRTIVVRDADGAVQVFPNGTITALANLSKQFAYATLSVRVAYGEQLDRVFGTLHEIGAGLQRDPFWSAMVLEPIQVAGVTSLADGAATVEAKVKTLPLKQGEVANELRRRTLAVFVARGIRPYAG